MPGRIEQNPKTFDRVAPSALIAVALLALCLFLAGMDDGIHHFRDQHGVYQVVISTDVLSRLLPSLAFAAVVLGAVWLLSSAVISRIAGARMRDVAKIDALSYAPLAILLLLPIRYLPGLAQFSSALFLLSTTFSSVLLAVAVMLVVALKIYLLRDLLRRKISVGKVSNRFSDRALGWVVFIVFVIVLSYAIPQFSATWPFGGDEPHYLVITHSLLEDGDIYFQDDYDAGVYRRFSQWQRMTPQFLRPARDGRAVPVHRIGMPLLAVPPYAVAGKLGAVLMIGLFAALAAANLYWLVIKVVPDRGAALAAVAWVALSVPMLPLSFLFYTEVPLACFILIALNMIIQPASEPPRWPWVIPFVIWLLPWIHARGYITAVALSILLVVRLKRRAVLAAGLAALCVLLSLGIPIWNWWLYGEFGILAEMGEFQHADVSIGNVFKNLAGLLFDQEFGLLLYNAALIPALVGCVSLWRRRPSALVWALVVVVFTLGPGLAYQMWWGGDSSPARYAAPIMPLAALPLAALLADARWKRWRKAAAVAAVCSVAVAIALMVNSGLVTNQRDGTAQMLTAVSIGPHDAVEWWPSWFAPPEQFWLSVALLLLSISLVSAVVIIVSKAVRGAGESGTARLFAAFGVVFLTCVVSLVIYDKAAAYLTPGEPNGTEPHYRWSDLAYQQRYRHGKHILVDQQGTLQGDSLPERGFSASRLFSGWALAEDPLAVAGKSWRINPGRQEIALRSSTSFWAGEYRLVLGLRAESGEADVEITVFDESQMGNTPWGPMARKEISLTADFKETVFPVRLAGNSIGVRIYVETGGTLRFSHARMTALSLDKLASWKLPAGLFDRAALRFNDYTLYTDPTSIHTPDGKWFWTRGDSEAVWTLVSPRPFASIKLSLVGHPPVAAEALSGGRRETVGFDRPGQKREIELPVKARRIAGKWMAEIRLLTKGTFVPAATVEGSTDERRLGVHTRISLLGR